ncbi:MAG: MFS transporter, partial [Alphaproteobacteria bacterium]|nr:MFS transporter [Alphaproteobacteria bacterium]
AAGLSLTAAGAALFGAAPNLATAYVALAVLGLGCSPLYMATVVVLAREFARARFAALNGTVVALSNAGLILSATPLAALDLWLGWRGALWAAAGVTALLAIAMACAARGESRGMPESLGRAVAGVAAVARHRPLWALLPFSFVCSGVILAVRGVWAGPYLDQVHALGPIERGHVLAGMVLALACGNLLFGWLSARLGSPKPFVAGLACVGVAATGGLALFPAMATELAILGLLAIGFYGASYALVIAHGRAFFPPGKEGRGATFLNFVNFLGTAVWQTATGAALGHAMDAGAGVPGGYAWVFAVLAAALAASTLHYLTSTDPRRAS